MDRSFRTDTGLPENVVCVDVADASNQILTQKYRFDASASAAQHRLPSDSGKCRTQRFDAQARQGFELFWCRCQIHVAKAPLIDKPQIKALKLYDGAGVP